MKYEIAENKVEREKVEKVWLKYSLDGEYIWVCVGTDKIYETVFSLPTRPQSGKLPVVIRGGLEAAGFADYLSHPDRYRNLTGLSSK